MSKSRAPRWADRQQRRHEAKRCAVCYVYPRKTKMKRHRCYFIACNGLIKIGYSASVNARIAQIKNTVPWEVVCLGVLQGARSDEAALHKRFAAFRYERKKEWFYDHEEIREFVKNNCVSLKEDNIAPLEIDADSMDGFERSRSGGRWENEDYLRFKDNREVIVAKIRRVLANGPLKAKDFYAALKSEGVLPVDADQARRRMGVDTIRDPSRLGYDTVEFALRKRAP